MKRLIIPAMAALMAISGPAFAQQDNGRGRGQDNQDNNGGGNRGGRGGQQQQQQQAPQQQAPQQQAPQQQAPQQQAPANNPPRTLRDFSIQAGVAVPPPSSPAEAAQDARARGNAAPNYSNPVRGGSAGRGGFVAAPANNNPPNNNNNFSRGGNNNNNNFNNNNFNNNNARSQQNFNNNNFNNNARSQQNFNNNNFNNNGRNQPNFNNNNFNNNNNRSNNWDQARNLRNYSRTFNAPRRYRAEPFYYPRGYSYTRFRFGDYVPNIFWARDYWIDNYYYFGLDYPPPGFTWVRFGPDALLIDQFTGEVVEVEYNIFY